MKLLLILRKFILNESCCISYYVGFFPNLTKSMGIFIWSCMDLGFMLLKKKEALSVELERMGLTSKDLQTPYLILDLFSKEFKYPTFSFVVLNNSALLSFL